MKRKFISGTIALGYLSVAYFVKGSTWALKATGSMVLPLACIWVSEAMGGYVGGVGRGRITAPTPAFFVALGGCVDAALIMPAIADGKSTFLMSKTTNSRALEGSKRPSSSA